MRPVGWVCPPLRRDSLDGSARLPQRSVGLLGQSSVAHPRSRLGSTVIACIAVSACAGVFRNERIDAFVARFPLSAYLQEHAIRARCPLIGLRGEALRTGFGQPKRIDTIAPGHQVWAYQFGRDAPQLAIVLAADTIQDWTVNAPGVWRRFPLPPGFHPQRDSAAAWAYLAAHPETDSRFAFGILAACVIPGMSYQEVVATWGSPEAIDSALVGGSLWVRYTYGYGAQGQGDELDFYQGQLVDGQPWVVACSPSRRSHGKPPPRCRLTSACSGGPIGAGALGHRG